MRTRFLCASGLFSILLPLGSSAQSTCVSGYLVEAATQAPLRFAVVQLQHNGTAAVADEHGYFELKSATPWERDSLLVFTDRVHSAHWVNSNSPRLHVAVAAPPVSVRNRRGRLKHVAAVPSLAGLWGLPGSQYAFFVNNTAPSRRRTLRTVSFYIGDGAIPREPFRVRLYQVAANGPGTELPPEMLQVFAPQSNAWVTVNLADYHVAVPEAGYFVALEFLVGGSMRPSETAIILPEYTPTGQLMCPVYAVPVQNAWRYVIGSGWERLPWHNGIFARYGAMIKLEVAP